MSYKVKSSSFPLFALLISLFLCGASYAQQLYDLNTFDGIKSEGPVPGDLRLGLGELYTLDKQRVRDYNDGRLRNRDKVLAASYQINKIMSSGRVLYGDPITRLVERIADTLLKDYPDLRRELRFYTLKSPDVNAFATGQGMVFVCTGLVAQVEDESQLAFIISHEIVHYLRKHTLEEITRRKHDSDDIDAETQEMRDFIKYHNRSREMESEADSLGLVLFYLNSPYSRDVVGGVFDVLQYGYLPFDEQPFDTAFFNTPFYRMADDCFMDQVDPITARDDYNDSLSTHPNILKRRLATASVIGGATGGSRFVTVSEQEFDRVRALARFECVRQDIIYSDYARAFYDCYLLRKLYPDNAYVERAMCQALYGLSKFKTYTNTSGVVGDYKHFEGDVQQCYYFFRRVKRDDLALITARYLWQGHRRYPDDSQIAAMTDDIFSDLFAKYSLSADFFASRPPEQEVRDSSDEKLSKYERLKRKKNRQHLADSRAYAFTDLLINDPELAPYMAAHLKPRLQTSPDAEASHKNQIVYCPTYYVISKKAGEMNILKSENGENDLYRHISDAAAKKGIGSIDFSDQALQGFSSASQYNEWVELNEWVGEFWQTKADFDMNFSTQPQMDRIVRRYDAGSINMSVVLNREDLSSSFDLFDMFAIIVVPFIPFAVNDLLAHREATVVYTVQIDAEHARGLSKHTAIYNLRDEKARIRSALYDHYAHIDSDTLRKATGYMGSRFALALQPTIGVGPALFNNSSVQSLSFPRNSLVGVSAELELQYNVSRRGSLLLSAGYTPSSCHVDGTSGLLDLNRYQLSFGWRQFRTPPPLGYFFDFAVDLVKFSLPDLPDNSVYNTITGGLRVGLGRNHLFYDHLLFGYFARFGFLFNNPTIQGDYLDNAARHLSSIMRFGVTIGLVP